LRYKDTIRLVKEALHNPNLYSEAELEYMKRAYDSAKLGLAKKKALKKQKGFGHEQSTGEARQRKSKR